MGRIGGAPDKQFLVRNLKKMSNGGGGGYTNFGS